MSLTGVFTIVAKNYLPYARVLMRSVKEHHPDWRRIVILADKIDGRFDPADEDFEVVLSKDLAIPRPAWFHFKYTILELCTAVKPYAFEYLFEHGAFDRILYLDPDIKLFAPLTPVTELLNTANIVLTPHLTGALNDDRRPSEIDILRSGAYNLGFIALAKSPQTAEFLAWWRQRLYDHCVVDLPRGLFVDQRWIDLAPSLFEGVAISRDPGLNVAYWNLSHRIVSHANGSYSVESKPLRFFHFSGYSPDRPEELSCHQNRFTFASLPDAVQRLLRGFREDLVEAGFSSCRKWPYAFARFHNGEFIPDLARPLHHESPEIAERIEDPFSEEGFRASLDVWNAPVLDSADDSEGSRRGVSRLAYRIYRTRTDVQSAMPDIFGGNYKRFLEWMLVSGQAEHGLGAVFLSTVSDAFRTAQDTGTGIRGISLEPNGAGLEPPGNAGQGLRLTRLAAAIYQSRPELQRYFPDPRGRDGVRFLTWMLTYGKKEHDLSEYHLAPLRAQWRAIVQSLPSTPSRLWHKFLLHSMDASVFMRSTLRRLTAHWMRLRVARTAPPDQLYVPEAPVEFGVNLVGYFRSETGVGQSARAACAALRSVSVPISLRCSSDGGPTLKQDQTVGPMSTAFPYAANLFYVNADEAPHVKQSFGEAFYRNRRNIGFWVWELDEFPEEWRNSFSIYDEIWTPSTFCRDAIARVSPIPVHAIPYAVAPKDPPGMDRDYFGLPRDRFLFLSAFDALSVVERKNPFGCVQAFRSAFGDDPRYQLILKVNNAAYARRKIDTLKDACGPNVRIVESTLSREEMYALARCCDCAVSLHRSEGFGLFIAEAMYFGKPVIATNYSGNTDFTSAENSLLVDYQLISVGKNCAPYNPHAKWADPDLVQAAAHMRLVAEDDSLRTRLGRAGSDFVRRELSEQAVGAKMRRRLEEARMPPPELVAGMAVAGGSRKSSGWSST